MANHTFGEKTQNQNLLFYTEYAVLPCYRDFTADHIYLRLFR